MAVSGSRIILVDDHPLFRNALRVALQSVFPVHTIEEAGSFDELVECLGQNSEADLLLLDLMLPDSGGFTGLHYVRSQYPTIPVIVVSAITDEGTINHCVDFGASGYIPKSASIEETRQAIRTVMAGGLSIPTGLLPGEEPDPSVESLVKRLKTLTPQQVRVLIMVAKGLLNKQIAHNLDVSEATVKAHVSAILQKLGVGSRTQAVIAVSRIEGSEWMKTMN